MAGAAAGLLAVTGMASAAVDVDALWDYARPELSESRFRAALPAAQGDELLVLRTQIARTYSLRRLFDEAHRELDAIEPQLGAAGAEPRVRALLERGRTWRSSGKPLEGLPLFRRAFELAEAAGLQRLAADALHMVALAEPGLEERIAWNRRTIDYAQRSTDERARAWRAAAMNNIGSDLREAGRLEDSLLAFEEALAAHRQIGREDRIRIARWQVANVLRLLGRVDEALRMQLELERECEAAGAPDRYVFEELAALYAARGDTARAEHYRALLAREAAR